MLILSGDIGGTNSRLAAYRLDDEHPVCCLQQNYMNLDYDHLSDLLTSFLQLIESRLGEKPQEACLAVAGPVENLDHHSQCQMTNIDWELRSDKLAAALGLERVYLINDFVAVAWSLDLQTRDTMMTVHDAGIRADEPAVFVGPGTGLGVAVRIPIGQQTRVLATEAGHTVFSPESPEQKALHDFLTKRGINPEWEAVISGPGLETLYHFYNPNGNGKTAAEISAVARNDIPANVHSAESHAMLFLCELLGLFCRNLALTFLPRGGLYLAGGVASKNLPVLRQPAIEKFESAFLSHPAHAGLLKQIPVKLFLEPEPGLAGATHYLVSRLQHDNPVALSE